MKNAFTLIELLAVIVILAILALIVTPIISGVISDAKKAAAARSLDGYVKAVEYAQVKYQYANNGSITTDIAQLTIEGSNIQNVTSPNVTFNSAGLVNTVTATIDDYTCTYSNSVSNCE